MKVICVFLIICLIVMTSVVFAMPSYFNTFKITYKIIKDSNIDKSSCLVCHAVKYRRTLNLYGLDVKKEMDVQKVKKVISNVLIKIDNLDSNKDGIKNIDHIKNDTLPGEINSKK